MKNNNKYYFKTHYDTMMKKLDKKYDSKCSKCKDYGFLVMHIKTLQDKNFDQYQVDEFDYLCKSCLSQHNNLENPQDNWELLAKERGFTHCEHIKENGNHCNMQIMNLFYSYHQKVGVKIVGSVCQTKIIDDGLEYKNDEGEIVLALLDSWFDTIESKIDNIISLEKGVRNWKSSTNPKGNLQRRYKKTYNKGKKDYHHLTMTVLEAPYGYGLSVYFGEDMLVFSKNNKPENDVMFGNERDVVRLALLIQRYREFKFSKNPLVNGYAKLIQFEFRRMKIKSRLVKSNQY